MIEHVLEGCQCEGKVCTKCSVLRCHAAFSRDKRLRSGLKSQCRICSKKASKIWHQAHAEHNAEYRQANRNRLREADRKHYHNNRERYRTYALVHAKRISEYKKVWRKNNIERERASRRLRKERISEQRKARYSANPDKALARSREFKKKHPKYYREYARANPEVIRVKTAHRRARKKKAGGTYTVVQWEALKEHYEYSCLCCGRKEPEIKLTVDHVVPLTKGGENTINNIQPLCFSCNAMKRTKIIDYRTK